MTSTVATMTTTMIAATVDALTQSNDTMAR
jgi:hypothetical protein